MSLWQKRTIEERTAILQAAATENNMEELAVEKDWWGNHRSQGSVCHFLCSLLAVQGWHFSE